MSSDAGDAAGAVGAGNASLAAGLLGVGSASPAAGDGGVGGLSHWLLGNLGALDAPDGAGMR